jgi:hypothetical protein
LFGDGKFDVVTGGRLHTNSGNGATINVSAGNNIHTTISGGTVSGGGNTFAIEYWGGGSITVSGGTVTANDTAIFVPSGHSTPITISSGTVSGSRAIVGALSTVNISGGTITGTGSSNAVQSSTINISGGTINATGTNSTAVNGSTVNINGGTIRQTGNGSWDTGIQATTININGNTTIESTHGEALFGNTTISGGTVIILGDISGSMNYIDGEDNIKIVLLNSNPATIMTDSNIADKIYIEPLTLTTVKRIIEKERPDSILSGLGGQTGLTLCMKLAKEGFLEKMNVRAYGF